VVLSKNIFVCSVGFPVQLLLISFSYVLNNLIMYFMKSVLVHVFIYVNSVAVHCLT
jgi:hypothetical protein